MRNQKRSFRTQILIGLEFAESTFRLYSEAQCFYLRLDCGAGASRRLGRDQVIISTSVILETYNEF